MKFEVINEKLKIAACSLSDLTIDHVQGFLQQWESDACIGTLSLFFDRESGYVVLNRDNKNYKLFLSLTERFMSADKQEREMIYQKAPKCIKETLLVLTKARVARAIDQEIFRAKKNFVSDKERRIITEIERDSLSPMNTALIAFRYGVMCGKRAERARRKKK